MQEKEPIKTRQGSECSATEWRWQISNFLQLSTPELYAMLRLRQQVFVIEQACIYQDLDDLDQAAVHIMCWRDDDLLAYQRCLAPGAHFEDSALGRIVVAAEARGDHLGKALVRRGLEHNLQHWPQHGVGINAQAHLQAFYEGLGFVSEGEAFDEDGIAHIHMRYRCSV